MFARCLQPLEAEAAAQLYCPRSASSETLTRARCRRAKVTGCETLIEPSKVRNVEHVEDLEESLNLHSFANLEGLGYANVFGLKVVAEGKGSRHNQRLDSGAGSVRLAR